jgi:4-hydroxy-2-oxoheptanedioate aldolase
MSDTTPTVDVMGERAATAGPGVAESRHVNGAISLLSQDLPFFATFSPADPTSAQSLSAGAHDAVIFEMEHAPWDPAALRHSLQYLLDRRQIVDHGDISPTITPLVRIPANGSEMNQWLAKQALDAGVYGVVWPHVSTVEEGHNAVAACRYPRPSSDPRYEPAGFRGFGPTNAARYWGLSVSEYCDGADTWPLAPDGDVLVVIMCEEYAAVRNLPQILAEVPGIGAVLLGTADLSMDLGHNGRDHPEVEAAVQQVLSDCTAAGVACGIPGVTVDTVVPRLEQGFRMLLPNPPVSQAVAERGKAWLAGRTPAAP